MFPAKGARLNKLLQGRTHTWSTGQFLITSQNNSVAYGSNMFELSNYNTDTPTSNGTDLRSVVSGLGLGPASYPYFFNSTLKCIGMNRGLHHLNVTAYLLKARRDCQSSIENAAIFEPQFMMTNVVNEPLGYQAGDDTIWDWPVGESMEFREFWKIKQSWSEWIQPGKGFCWNINVRRMFSMSESEIVANRIDHRVTWAIMFKVRGQPIGDGGEGQTNQVAIGPSNLGVVWQYKSSFSVVPAKTDYMKKVSNLINPLYTIGGKYIGQAVQAPVPAVLNYAELQ